MLKLKITVLFLCILGSSILFADDVIKHNYGTYIIANIHYFTLNEKDVHGIIIKQPLSVESKGDASDVLGPKTKEYGCFILDTNSKNKDDILAFLLTAKTLDWKIQFCLREGKNRIIEGYNVISHIDGPL